MNSGIGAYLAPRGGSILPEYQAVGGSILPQYSAVGAEEVQVVIGDAVVEDPNVTRIDEVQIEGETPEQIAQRTAAMRAGLMFFTGIALGYIWGGTTRGGVRG